MFKHTENRYHANASMFFPSNCSDCLQIHILHDPCVIDDILGLHPVRGSLVDFVVEIAISVTFLFNCSILPKINKCVLCVCVWCGWFFLKRLAKV